MAIRCAKARRACRPTNGMGPLPDEDIIPIQISDTVTRGTVKPIYPVAQYPTIARPVAMRSRTASSTAARGFRRYEGQARRSATSPPAVCGTPTAPRMLAADDGERDDRRRRSTRSTTDLRRLTEEKFRERGGKATGASRHGHGVPAGDAWTCDSPMDTRWASCVVLTKSDGMIQEGDRCQSRDCAAAASAATARIRVRRRWRAPTRQSGADARESW